MKASYWQRGEALDYINSTDKKVEAGDVLVMGSRIGVAGMDIPAGGLGSVHVTGVYEFDKAEGEELAVGTSVYYSADGITASESSGEGEAAVENVPAGFVAADSPADSAKVYVKINA